MTFNKSLILLTIFFNLNAQAVFESQRCTLRLDSLNSKQAKQRSLWALKCFPDLRFQADEDGLFYMVDSASEKKYIGYPTFAKIDSDGTLLDWSAPTNPEARCVDTQVYKIAGFCRAGCYTPDQIVLFSDGYQSIDRAQKTLRSDIISLSKNSTLEKIELNVSELRSYTIDPEAILQSIAIIQTQEGGELKVTLNHPLVTSSGTIKEARDLKKGDKLVSEDGTFEAIQSIEVEEFYGKVVNVEMDSTNYLDNIVVAQGYLNGSVMYQNQNIKRVNREILRTLIPEVIL